MGQAKGNGIKVSRKNTHETFFQVLYVIFECMFKNLEYSIRLSEHETINTKMLLELISRNDNGVRGTVSLIGSTV